MADKKPLYGVGGWLTFLIVILVGISPLLGFGSLSQTFSSLEANAPVYLLNAQWEHYKAASWMLYIITIGMSISAGINLWRSYRPSSVSYAIFCMWAIGIGSPLADLLVTLVIYGSDKFNATYPFVVGELLRGFFVATIWSAYLLKSKRVKNTYYSQPTNEASIATETTDDITG